MTRLGFHILRKSVPLIDLMRDRRRPGCGADNELKLYKRNKIRRIAFRDYFQTSDIDLSPVEIFIVKVAIAAGGGSSRQTKHVRSWTEYAIGASTNRVSDVRRTVDIL